jgi:hypothetical protein
MLKECDDSLSRLHDAGILVGIIQAFLAGPERTNEINVPGEHKKNIRDISLIYILFLKEYRQIADTVLK